MEIVIERNINIAHEGWELWLDFIKHFQIGRRDCVVVMPSEKKEYNVYSMLYLKQFQKAKKVANIFIITCENYIQDCIHILKLKNVQTVYKSAMQISCLMKYYCLQPFYNGILFISLEEPEGRQAYKLINDVFSIEELIVYGIYDLIHFKKMKLPAKLKEML